MQGLNFNKDWKYLLISGATASGKTNLAAELAERSGAWVVNCDSMQIYKELAILNTRPNEELCKITPHLLYGYVSGKNLYSVGCWIEDVKNILRIHPEQKLIFVGGTGLYFQALLGNLAIIPEIREEIRSYWRTYAQNVTNSELYLALQERDKLTALGLKSQDKHRIIRALEVFESTGKSLAAWQKESCTPILQTDKIQKILLSKDRNLLYKSINSRTEKLIKKGAVEEVINLLKLELTLDKPIMKAIGVSEISDYLVKKTSLSETIELIKIHTRQYAKRQLTWQRRYMVNDWKLVEL